LHGLSLFGAEKVAESLQNVGVFFVRRLVGAIRIAHRPEVRRAQRQQQQKETKCRKRGVARFRMER